MVALKDTIAHTEALWTGKYHSIESFFKKQHTNSSPALGFEPELVVKQVIGTKYLAAQAQDDKSRDPCDDRGKTSPKQDSGLQKKECKFAVEVAVDDKAQLCPISTANMYTDMQSVLK